MQVFCFGEVDWCPNIIELIKGSDPSTCPEPVKVEDVTKETIIIFWEGTKCRR